MRSFKTPRVSFTTISIAAAILCAGLSAAGCSGDDPGPVEPAPLVDVPEINGAVAADDFCDLASQIHCAGALGCCSGDEKAFANVEECIQQSSCAKDFGDVLASSLVKGGTLVYDADAAGDHLRALASKVSQCGASTEATSRPTYLIGSREQGADCSPQGGDRTNTLTCKPGLECALTVDIPTGVEKGTCMSASSPASDVGVACASGEDCSSGVCTAAKCAAEPDTTSEYCAAPPEETAPSNATPTKMYIRVHGNDNSGSGGDVTLTYANGGKYYECTITDSLADNAEKTCTITTQGTVTNSNSELFWVAMPGNDGLRIDTICAYGTENGADFAIECVGEVFDPGNNNSWSENCGAWIPWENGQYCGSFWLDGDGHGNCNEFQINSYNSNYTICDP
jgi:hypothetical protein